MLFPFSNSNYSSRHRFESRTLADSNCVFSAITSHIWPGIILIAFYRNPAAPTSSPTKQYTNDTIIR